MEGIEVSKKIKAIIEGLKQYPEVMAIILFGSYAKGTEKELSDIDIAVILKEWNKELEAEIGSMYSNQIDVVLFHRLPLHIQYEVFKYGKELFCRDENFLLECKFKVLRNYLEMSWMYERIKARVLK